jgi:anthranilate phosphoribosyltransferase
MSDLKPLLAKLADGKSLSREESRLAFTTIMSGDATPSQIGGLLMAMRVRGETVDEITGAVDVMRARMTRVTAPADAIDIVGTGGDASGSYNISTCAAFVAAGAGLKVAKHGNRALSSKSGSADVLTALGVKVDASPETIGRCIADVGLGFMFAPAHHTSMKHVGPTRVEMGVRTIFNLLGPLSNPASVTRQVVGVYSKAWVEPLAHVLQNLGSDAAWICHGEGGMDELVPSGTSWVTELRNGKIRSFALTPEECGLTRSKADALLGGDASHNAIALREVLQGHASAYADAALMAAAAALIIAGKADTMLDGVRQGRTAITSGKAVGTLEKLVSVSNS